MRLYPAIDVLGGSAVRLVRGDFEAGKVYDRDPLAAAQAWVRAGAEHLHVVDLDGARRGEPVNLAQLRRIAAAGVPVQYGGGLRSLQAIDAALAAGATRVILGTVAFAEPDVLRAALDVHGPERILVGVDVRGGRVATHGWLTDTDVRAREAFAALRESGVRRFVFTDIDHDGMLDGADREQVAGVALAVAGGDASGSGGDARSSGGDAGSGAGGAGSSGGGGSVIFSGGIGSRDDLRELARLRAERSLDALEGVIVGTALYERRFTVAEAKEALSLR